MYKSNLFHQKEEIFHYPSDKIYNLLSPPYNPKLKSRPYINPNLNANIPKFRPLNLYSSCFSPFQNGKNLSVNGINSPDLKETQNLLSKFSPNQKGTNPKIIGSPNTTNSDLLTAASLTSQQSNESLLSNNNNNNSIYVPTSFQPYNINRFSNSNYYSMINPNSITNINFCNNMSNNNIININGKIQNFQKYKINNKEDLNNFNSNNSSKSSSDKSNNTGSSKSTNTIKKGKVNGNSNNNLSRKKYFNKFNSAKENITNENTVILTLKIKVAKNDYRFFNLKKYDDLFISLEKFFDLNKIEQSLVKPIVNKIFAALNKIFWLLNNKIGKYDQKYLSSLYKLWKKNNETLPRRYKEGSNNSTISSSSESNEDKKQSNSFQEVNNLSEDDKDEKQKTAKSI